MPKKLLARLGAVVLAAVVAAAGPLPALAAEGEGEETTTPTPAPTLTISLGQASLTMEAKETKSMTFTVDLDYGGDKDPEDPPKVTVTAQVLKTQEESEPTVVNVGAVTRNEEDGSYSVPVTGVAPGEATIQVTAKAGAVAETKNFTATVRGLRLLADDEPIPEAGIEILVGDQKQLSVRRYGENDDTSQVEWSSDSPSIAYIPGSGMVVGSTVGTTTVTATIEEVGSTTTTYTASCIVNVVEDKSKIVEYTMGTVRQPLSLANLVSALQEKCLENLEQPLSYLRGLSVSPRQGVLYYNYVSSGNTGNGVGSDSYYISAAGGQLKFGDITFVPNPEFSGTAEIRFTAFSTGNNSYNGVIRITVQGEADVAYSTTGDPVHLDAGDFAAVYQRVNGGASLRSVRFTGLPPATQGIFYYKYNVTDVYMQRVTANTDYYRSSTPRLDEITFVPAAGYAGQVQVPYTAVGGSGATYKGTLTIEVEGDGNAREDLEDISYTGGASIALDGEDFSQACQTGTGAELQYIYLTDLPGKGTLYYDYGGPGQKAADVTQAYFLDQEPRISSLTFVAQGESQQSTSFDYTGVNANGDGVAGKVNIEMNVPGSSAIRYSGNSLPVRFRASSFSSACQTLLEEDIDHIVFTSLADEAYGKLYAGYESLAKRGSLAQVGEEYALTGEDAVNLVFVPQAGFVGRVSFGYTGFSKSGKNFTGTVTVSLASNFPSPHFTDMGSYFWALPSVEFLYSAGVVDGVGGGSFSPGNAIKRGDFALMLCRAFQFKNQGLESFPDVDPNKYYAWAVAAAWENGVVLGDDNGMFRPDATLSRQDAMVMLYRALDAYGVRLPAGQFTSLMPFTDRMDVSVYARTAVASLVELGIVGGSNNRLNPQTPIRRAEMAKMLHYALTL